jgi:AAA family ATP:ADP antiporter
MSTKPTDQAEFSKLRALLWPIHNHEMKKFLPLGLIMFCLLFNYTILRDLKDSIVVNASGAGTIPFLKGYCVTPAAILFVILYAKLSNAVSRENVFYYVVTPFLVFFGFYGFFIQPNAVALQASAETLASWHQKFPYLSNFNDVVGNWAYSLFYIMSEIWGSSMIALLFWQFANQITRMSESKRFYGLFVVIGNVALIFSGEFLIRANNKELIASMFPGADPFTIAVQFFMTLVVIFGLVAMGLYRWMHTSVLTDPKYYDEAEVSNKPKKKKEKPSLMESAKLIFTSPELGLIAMLIMAYGVTINLVEVQWKEQIRLYANGDRNVYAAFMGAFSQWNGIITIIFSWFIGSSILRRFSWFTSAVITPAFMIIGGALFFAFILFRDYMGDALSYIFSSSADPTRNAIVAATFLGFAVVVMSKSIKYSLFDPTKEMAYIPLSDELKSKGKAAVDVIGGRAGKSGGALAQTFLLMAFATKDVLTIAPITFWVFSAVMIGWILSVKLLSTKVALAIKAKAKAQ